MARLLIVEPFFAGSHRAWSMGYSANSQHEIQFLTLSGKHWKWRMQAGAISLADQLKKSDFRPDIIIASDMLNLPLFKAMINSDFTLPVALYFHENQLTYPKSEQDTDLVEKRDNHYAFINYTSALTADRVFFNSSFHQENFLNALSTWFRRLPKHGGQENIEKIRNKSQVLHLGLDLASLNIGKKTEPHSKPLICWNHRWEYDKCPDRFISVLASLIERDVDFDVALLGERFEVSKAYLDRAKSVLGNRIVFNGYAESKEEYAHWLWKSDILPVTSEQDFFGISVVEAMHCNCFPLLPNRLAFPEHIPEEHQGRYFYANARDLEERLIKCILNIEKTREDSCSSYVEKYNWKEMAPIYDATFENMLLS